MREFWLIILSLLFLASAIQANDGQWKTYTVADGLVNPDVTTIFQDRIGDLWFGTMSGGISRFDNGNIRSFTDKDGLPDGSVRDIFEDKQGHLWFIIANGPVSQGRNLVCRYDGKKFHQITEKDGLTEGLADVVLRDKSGNIWIANKYGLLEYDGKDFRRFRDGKFQQFILDQSGKDGRINTIYESRNGDIWLAGGRSLRRPNEQREKENELPFIIRYDGKKYHYLSLEAFPDYTFSSIHAIAEDNSGNFWFGGRFILIKYDGKKFERFDNQRKTEAPGNSAMRPNVGQVLITWKEPLGTDGEPLFSVEAGLGPPSPPDQAGNGVSQSGNKNYRYQNKIGMLWIDSIFKDSNGNLWFNNRGFVSRWNGKELKHFIIPENWQEIREFKTIYYIKNQVWLDERDLFNFCPGHVVLEDAKGGLWFNGSNGAHRFNGKTFQTYTIDDGLGSDNISSILETMDGKFWFGHDNGATLFDASPPVIQNFTMRAILGSNSVRFIDEDKQGFVWFSIRGGIGRYDGEKMQYFTKEQMGKWHPGFSSDRVTLDTNLTVNILDGGKNGLWFVGNETDQIFRYKDGGVERYSVWRDRVRRINRYDRQRGGFSFSDKNLSAVDPEGNLWLAVGRSLIKCNGESFQFLTDDVSQDMPSDFRRDRRNITDIHIDHRGNIWITYFGEGIKQYNGTGIKAFTTANGLATNDVWRIFEDKQGNLWFAGDQAIMMYDGRSFQNHAINDINDPPKAIHQDNHGAISLIYQNNVAKYDNGNFVLLHGDKDSRGALGDRQVWSSTMDGSGNLWLATNRGIIKYDGDQFTAYTTDNGLLVNDIRDVLVDSQGILWCATWGGGGAIYNGENFQAITTKDGLIHNNVRSIYEDGNGNMWFATEGGITKYTPKTDILPRIKLTKIVAEDSYTVFDEDSQISMQTGHVTFEYQGVSLQQSKLLYAHKLEGYDTDWSQPSLQKQAQYDGLKPGSYTFLVKAFREGSVYSNSPAFIQFTVVPAFWMQSQFYLPAAIAAMALASFVFLISRLIVQRRRTSVLRAQLHQKEEAEIQRVKKELNDAREMQMNLLPSKAPNIPHFELAGISIPANEVGGDFYDYLTFDNDLIGIVLADVSGKGLHGAMSAVMTYGILHEVVHTESMPAEILFRLNTNLCPLLRDSMFAALNFSILDPQAKRFCYTNAGQPYPVIKRNGNIKTVELGGLPLGLMTGTTYDEKTIDLNSGDYVIFYTDGITDAMNQAEDLYGFDRFGETIKDANSDISADEMIQHIMQDIQFFVGDAEQFDDMTVVVLRYIGS